MATNSPYFKRRITVETEDGHQTYSVVALTRAEESNAYEIYIDSAGGAWLDVGTYMAMISDARRVSGRLTIIAYHTAMERRMFYGLFRPGTEQ